MPKKQRSYQLDSASLLTLNEQMAEIQTSVAELDNALQRYFSWKNLLKIALKTNTWVKALRDDWPGEDKKAVQGLATHGYFVEHYCKEENRDFVESNLTSLKADVTRVKAEIARLEEKLKKSDAEVLDDIRLVEDSVARSYLEESQKCLQSGAYRASMVMSGCALESRIRGIYEETKGTNSQDLDFSKLIGILERDRAITSGQGAMVHLCRSFRNLTAHPSGFACNEKEATILLQLAVEQLKKVATRAKEAKELIGE